MNKKKEREKEREPQSGSVTRSLFTLAGWRGPVMHYKKPVMSFVLGGSGDKFKDHRSIKPL